MSTVPKKKILAVMILLLSCSRLMAQQNTFGYTQYMDNLTPLNPAYSVLDKAGSLNLLTRNQYVGIAGAPATFLFNGNLPIANINGAAGVSIFNDKIAVENQTEVNAYFAKSIQLGQADYLAVSLNAGIRNYVANYSALDPADPAFRDDVRQTKPNLGFGILYYTSWYYLGVSVPELTITSLGTASQQQNSNFRNHYYFAGALVTKVTDEISFKPATLVTYSQGLPLVANLSGMLYLKDSFGVGANYRTDKQAAGILSVKLDTFRLGYSYQFSTSSNNLGGLNNATHEVTLSYRFGQGALNPQIL